MLQIPMAWKEIRQNIFLGKMGTNCKAKKMGRLVDEKYGKFSKSLGSKNGMAPHHSNQIMEASGFAEIYFSFAGRGMDQDASLEQIGYIINVEGCFKIVQLYKDRSSLESRVRNESSHWS